MSAVLCLPACLCVSAAASRGQAPHGNASLARVRCPGPGGARSPACALCAVPVCRWWLCLSSSPPIFFWCLLVLFFFSKKNEKKFYRLKKKGAGVHCRHRHGQLVQWCNIVVFSGVCRRCFGGGRAPGVRSRVLMYTGMGQGGFG